MAQCVYCGGEFRVSPVEGPFCSTRCFGMYHSDDGGHKYSKPLKRKPSEQEKDGMTLRAEKQVEQFRGMERNSIGTYDADVFFRTHGAKVMNAVLDMVKTGRVTSNTQKVPDAAVEGGKRYDRRCQ